MDNKIIGFFLLGFGILILFSQEEFSYFFSAIAVGIGSGLIIKKSKKSDKDE